MLYFPSRGGTSKSDYSLSMHLEKIIVHALRWNLLSNQCVGGGLYFLGRHHLDNCHKGDSKKVMIPSIG